MPSSTTQGDTGTFAFTRLANDSTSGATTFASATIAPTIGAWYHLVGVYDASAKTSLSTSMGVFNKQHPIPLVGRELVIHSSGVENTVATRSIL